MSLWKEIYAVHYAETMLDYGTCYVNHPGDTRPQQIDYAFWILRGADGVIVVDTGFNADIAARRGRKAIVTPAQALDFLDIEPGDVKAVIMTHLHYDHAGNSDLYPHAQFYLQNAEWEFANGPDMTDPLQGAHYEAEDLARFQALLDSGRMSLIQGDGELFPGVEHFVVSGHTPGQMALRVAGPDGAVVLASDALHFYRNDGPDGVFPVTLDADAEARGYAYMRDLAAGSDRIVAGHDPANRDRWPAVDQAGRILDVTGAPRLTLAEVGATGI